MGEQDEKQPEQPAAPEVPAPAAEIPVIGQKKAPTPRTTIILTVNDFGDPRVNFGSRGQAPLRLSDMQLLLDCLRREVDHLWLRTREREEAAEASRIVAAPAGLDVRKPH